MRQVSWAAAAAAVLASVFVIPTAAAAADGTEGGASPTWPSPLIDELAGWAAKQEVDPVAAAAAAVVPGDCGSYRPLYVALGGDTDVWAVLTAGGKGILWRESRCDHGALNAATGDSGLGQSNPPGWCQPFAAQGLPVDCSFRAMKGRRRREATVASFAALRADPVVSVQALVIQTRACGSGPWKPVRSKGRTVYRCTPGR